MAPRPKTIDEYLASVPREQRAALQSLRKTIQAAAPDAEERIAYGMPMFHRNGMLVAFRAAAKHCSLFLLNATTVKQHARELAGYDTLPGTIHFQPSKPLPAALVRKLVRVRLAENDARRKPAKPTARTDPEVSAFLRKLDHPLKREIEAVRAIMLGASPEIREGYKWSSASYRTKDFFATVNWRSRDAVQLVFHMGAKQKGGAVNRARIPDPKGLIRWLAKDRCLVTVGRGKVFDANRRALQAIVRAWIRAL